MLDANTGVYRDRFFPVPVYVHVSICRQEKGGVESWIFLFMTGLPSFFDAVDVVTGTGMNKSYRGLLFLMFNVYQGDLDSGRLGTSTGQK